MSIIPYNNWNVRDLSNVQQPYINSCSEIGYFNGGNLGTINTNSWRSLPSVLNTNNGIANVNANGGLTILNAGIYSINLSIFPTSTMDGSSNISFNFGTTNLSSTPTTNVVNAFGGQRPTGMFTYDPSNNPYTPGIISWITDGYNSANSTPSNFIKNSITNELSYNYFNTGYPNRALYSGNCTTEMTFFLDSSATIYFNVSTNSTTGVTMGNCYFTLELICNNTALIQSLYWHKSGAPLANWSSIALDSGGSKLAASGTRIWTSNNYGLNWNLQIVNNLNWSAIAISGQPFQGSPFMAACVNGGYIYSSSDNGVNWFQRTFVPLNWTSIAPNFNGASYVACANGGGIWRSINNGVTWTQNNNDTAKKWSCIASDNGTTTMFACESPAGGIWRSTNNGVAWTLQSNAPISANWSSISTTITSGKAVACINGGAIWYTTDSGVAWTQGTAPTSAFWSGITIGVNNSNICYACVSNGGIYKSTDAGSTWTLQSGGLPASANWSSITTDNNGGQVAACVNGGRIWASKNGTNWIQATSDASRNWTNVASNYSTFAAVVSNGAYIYPAFTDVFVWNQQNADINRTWTSIASDSTRTKLAACASGSTVNTGGIWTSIDSGINWTPRTSGLPSSTLTTGPNWTSIASDSTGTNLAACVNGGGIYMTTNSGSSWALTEINKLNWSSIATSRPDTTTGIITLAACVNGGYIYTSTNSGNTWFQRTFDTTRNWSCIIGNATLTTLYACVSGGGIWRSTNSGVTWTPLAGGLPTSANWSSMSTDYTGAEVGACVNGGGIWVSLNSGTNWSVNTSGPNPANWTGISLYKENPSRYFVACIEDGGIWWSQNTSGLTWTVSDAPSPSKWSGIVLGATNSSSGNSFACVSGGGIWFSTGGGYGKNWTQRTTIGLPTTANWRTITANNVGTSVVVCETNGNLWSSTNTGINWTPQIFDASRNWSCVSAIDNTYSATAIGSQAVYLANSNPNSWTKLNIGQNWNSIASDSTGQYLAACASDISGGIWTSADSGLNWTPRTSLLPSGTLPTNVNWTSIASDSTGANLAACVSTGFIYTSLNYGASWTLQTNAGSRNWSSIASNNTGQNLAAVVNGGAIWLSTDSGANWILQTSSLPTNGRWKSIASDSTGTNLAAVTDGSGGIIYTRLNS